MMSIFRNSHTRGKNFHTRGRMIVPVSVMVLAGIFVFPGLFGQAQKMEENLARYARYGADVWARNPMATIAGGGKACVSCHTSLSYALTEPLIPGEYQAYYDIVDNVHHRVRTWEDNLAWYSPQRTDEIDEIFGREPGHMQQFLDGDDSRGSEVVLNALICATHDAYAGRPAGEETRLAFEHLWELQQVDGEKAGMWRWISASLIPWESEDSHVWGAALAGVASTSYPELVPDSSQTALRKALEQKFYDPGVSLHARAAILWYNASSATPFLHPDSALQLSASIMELQAEDGGWNLRQLGPWQNWEGSWRDCCEGRELRSDSYATGFLLTVFSCSGSYLPHGSEDALMKADAWIRKELANPYPDSPRYNRHGSDDKALPEFRNNLYSNNGHMWSYLALQAYRHQSTPWTVSGSARAMAVE